MATRSRQQPATDITPFVWVGGLVCAGVAFWYGLPPLPFVWLGFLVGAFTSQAPELTGKRDASGYPVPANAAEERRLAAFGAARDLRVGLIVPYRDLLPGKALRVAWFSAIILAVVAYNIPLIGNPHLHASSGRALDMWSAVWLTLALSGAYRRTQGADNPGMTLRSWSAYQKSTSAVFISFIALAGALAGLAVAIGLAIVIHRYGHSLGSASLARHHHGHPGLRQPFTLGWAVPWIVGGMWFMVVFAWRPTALRAWRELVEARSTWRFRWTSLKYDPAPTLVDHKVLGEGAVIVDTMDAPSHQGAAEFFRNESRLSPLMGPGEKVALVSVTEEGPQGPIPGVRSAVRFVALTWPQPYDVSSPDADPEIAGLWIQSGLAWVSRTVGVPFEPLLDTIQAVHRFGETDVDHNLVKEKVGLKAALRAFLREIAKPAERTLPTDDEPLVETSLAHFESDDEMSISGDDTEDEADTSQEPKLWRTRWHYREETVGAQVFRDVHLELLESTLQTGVLIDHRDGGTIYVGHLDAGEDEAVSKAIEKVQTEDLWTQIWTGSVKTGANLPVPQVATLSERPLANGSAIHRMAFALNLGNQPAEYMYPGVENKLKSALGTGRSTGASFVAVTGYPDSRKSGRPGDRHPQALVVSWSFDPVPRTPSQIAPASPADVWVLAGIVNEAFGNVKLAKPEIVAARCLTSPRAPAHAWAIQLRLYDGVTTGQVRAAAGTIADNLATPWVRVADAPDGCVLYAGIEPRPGDLANPDDAALVASLDWEQAFAVSRVVGSVGAVPSLVSVVSMPANPNVLMMDFELPPGLDKMTVKSNLGRLRTATGNAYLQIMDSERGPTFITLQASKESPLPATAPFDFDAADTSDGMAFATGVDGEPVEFLPRRDVHLAVIGMTGSGKSVTAQALLYGAAIKGYEIYVVDPMKGAADFKFLEPYARFMATDVHSAAACLKAIYAEVERRKNLNSSYGASGISDLPDDVRPAPIFIFIDEFTSLILAEKVPSRPFDGPDLEAERLAQKRVSDDRTAIAYFAGKLAREARSAGVSMALGTQKLMADSLKNVPGGGDLKTNLSRILLGQTSLGERMSALRAFDQAPDPGEVVSKGRGIWESSTSTGRLIQAWYAPTNELADALAERVDPIDPSNVLDVSGYTSKPLDSDDHDVAPPRRRGNEPVEEVVDLGEETLNLDDLLAFQDDDEPVDVEEPTSEPEPAAVVTAPRSSRNDMWDLEWDSPDEEPSVSDRPVDAVLEPEDDLFDEPTAPSAVRHVSPFAPRPEDDPFARPTLPPRFDDPFAD